MAVAAEAAEAAEALAVAIALIHCRERSVRLAVAALMALNHRM